MASTTARPAEADPGNRPREAPPTTSFDYDVAVVGAGPAGLVVAAYAARGGARVVLLERRAIIGEPLQCGELMPSNRQLELLCPGVPDIDELFQTPESAIRRHYRQIRLIAPRGVAYAFDFEGYTMDRPVHDQHLAKLACEAGAELRASTKVAHVTGNSLTLIPSTRRGWEGAREEQGPEAGHAEAGSISPGLPTIPGIPEQGETLSARVIIGADGPHSLVRQAAGLPRPRLSATRMALIEGDFPPTVDLHFGSVAPGGYAWVIPKAGGANIGVGIQSHLNRSGLGLRQIMEAFEQRFDGEVTYRGGGMVPISGPLCRTVSGPYILVGDAAGHVMPSNGGGICTAMMAGRVAGQVAARHTASLTAATGDSAQAVPLEEYETLWRSQLGRTFKYSVRAKRLADLMFNRDWKLNLAMGWWSVPLMRRALTCRPMFGVFWKKYRETDLV